MRRVTTIAALAAAAALALAASGSGKPATGAKVIRATGEITSQEPVDSRPAVSPPGTCWCSPSRSSSLEGVSARSPGAAP
jgi:hypothetical protein